MERAGRTGRPRTREEGKDLARRRRAERLDRPPTWRGSMNRAAVAAALFGVAVVVLGRPPMVGAVLAVLMFGLYIPLGYGTDLAIHRFRQRRKAAAGRK